MNQGIAQQKLSSIFFLQSWLGLISWLMIFFIGSKARIQENRWWSYHVSVLSVPSRTGKAGSVHCDIVLCEILPKLRIIKKCLLLLFKMHIQGVVNMSLSAPSFSFLTCVYSPYSLFSQGKMQKGISKFKSLISLEQVILMHTGGIFGFPTRFLLPIQLIAYDWTFGKQRPSWIFMELVLGTPWTCIPNQVIYLPS